MKKIIITFTILLISLFSMFFIEKPIYASNSTVIDKETESKLVEIKDREHQELSDYVEQYGDSTYGFVAYVLGKVRIYSIPFCFLGIAVGAIYQYIIGIRKLDVRDKGMGLIITFVTLLLICQVLPLVFTVVVKGWRN